jgi:hypothetical protein
MDVASELSQRPMAEKLFVSARRGVWIFPKYYRGQPLDKNPAPAWLPKGLKQWLGARMVKKLVGKMSDYGLPEPEIGPFESHGTVSGEFLVRAGSGDITMKGAVERLDGDGVVFADGSREQVDVIVWATGYDIAFPFFGSRAYRICFTWGWPSPYRHWSTSPNSRASWSALTSPGNTCRPSPPRWSG